MLPILCILSSNLWETKIMKKIYIAMAVIATAALASCQQEKSLNDLTLGENDILFSLQGSATTRSDEFVPEVRQGAVIPFETEDGRQFVLEETVVNLDEFTPATKGTPVYTENVGKMYKEVGVVIKKNGDAPTVAPLYTGNFGAIDDQMVGSGWRYQGSFSGWPDASTPLDFFLWMPVTGNGITGTTTYSRVEGKQTISFSYTSPGEAKDQKDLIFAARPISKQQVIDNRVNGVPVLFNHALTGVKFAIKNYSAEGKITIKSITFEGLVNSGSCVITPATENNYRDKTTTEYSSSADGVVVWTPGSTTGTFTSGDFGAPIDFKKKSEGGTFGDNGDYPDSFATGGEKNNLNKADASQTFWFIPQTLNDNVKLTITYTYGSDEEKTGVFEFGKALSNVTGTGDNQTTTYVTWKAGELRTYTIKVDDVNVTITDQFTESQKDNVQITNTGNTDAYIRAAIIGQWVDPSGNPVFGYTDFKSEQYEPATIPSWYQDFISDGGYYGSFNDFPGTGWEKGPDDYYYYTSPVPPAGHPTALFSTYTIVEDHIPPMKVGGKPVKCTLLIEVSTQAISAKKRNSSANYDTYTEAWHNAEIIASEAQTISAN